MSKTTLWSQASCVVWEEARSRYPAVLAASGGHRLVELDRWYQQELPATLAKREPPWLSLAELIKVVEWKMHRGVYRARNLALVRSNDPAGVEAVSLAAEIPELGSIDFTLKEYARYSERLRERAALLAVGCPDGKWTPQAVGSALWAAAGGKAG